MPKKLVNIKKISHEEWLSLRERGIGGSESAICVNMNPYAGLLTLYAMKTGMSKPKEDNEAMRLGRDLEQYVAERFTEETGKKVINDNWFYVDDEYDLTMCPNPDAQWGDPDYDVPMHSVNGFMGQNMMAEEPIHDNDFVKIGGVACSIMSEDWTTISWTTEIIPATDPNAVVDATISADEILFWVGEGQNEVVVALSWCSYTEAALAWGYRFDGEATVFQALTAIAAADSRLTVIGDAPSNITYVDNEYDLTMCPNPDAQWGDPDYDVPMHSVNGLMGMNMMAEEPIHNNDFVKIGGYACGIMSADWTTIAWEQPIEPAVNNTSVNENQSNTLVVYPNPAISEAFVSVENAGMTTVSVYDIQGRLVSEQSVDAKAGEQVRISTEMLNAGMYFITVSDDSAVRTAKLVVK